MSNQIQTQQEHCKDEHAIYKKTGCFFFSPEQQTKPHQKKNPSTAKVATHFLLFLMIP